MSIAFFKSKQEEFVGVLAEVLQTADTLVGRVGLSLGQRDKITKAIRRAVDRKTTAAPWFTEHLITDFVRDRVNAMLRASKRPGGTRSKLILWEPFKDTHSVAERLSNDVQTLPWQYVLMAPTPLVGKEGVVHLTENWEAVSFSDSAARKYDVEGVDAVDADVYGRKYPDRIEVGRYYLQYKYEGYIRDTEPTPEAGAFVDGFLGLIGLLYCDGALTRNYFVYGGLPPAMPVMIYRTTAARLDLVGYRWLSKERTAAKEQMIPRKETEQVIEERLQRISGPFAHTQTRSAGRGLLTVISELMVYCSWSKQRLRWRFSSATVRNHVKSDYPPSLLIAWHI